jgi:NADPH:quinone reductase-like Zn-dependent oxidoreductase
MAAPLNRQWRLNGFSGFDSLVLKDGQIPDIDDLDVLVRWKYASLNYRDLVVSKVFQQDKRRQLKTTI